MSYSYLKVWYNHGMRLLVFSDLHYADKEHYEPRGRKLSQYAEELMNRLKDQANKNIKPDACVFLGDYIEDTGDSDINAKLLRRALSFFEGFTMPCFVVPGNHEFKVLDRNEVAKIMDVQYLTYSIDFMGYHLVFLGLGVDEEKQEKRGFVSRSRFICDEDLDWLKKDLSCHRVPTIIFCHYGIADDDDMKNNYWFGENNDLALLDNRAELKKILKSSDTVKCVFSGHQHWTKHLVEDEIDYYVVGSLVEDVDGNGKPDGVFFVVDIDNGAIKITEQHLTI